MVVLYEILLRPGSDLDTFDIRARNLDNFFPRLQCRDALEEYSSESTITIGTLV
jgi:hypothetical protein